MTGSLLFVPIEKYQTNNCSIILLDGHGTKCSSVEISKHIIKTKKNESLRAEMKQYLVFLHTYIYIIHGHPFMDFCANFPD